MSTAAPPCVEDQSCRCPHCDAARDALAVGLAEHLIPIKADLLAHGVSAFMAPLVLRARARRDLKRAATERRLAWRPGASEFEAALDRALKLLFPDR